MHFDYFDWFVDNFKQYNVSLTMTKKYLKGPSIRDIADFKGRVLRQHYIMCYSMSVHTQCRGPSLSVLSVVRTVIADITPFWFLLIKSVFELKTGAWRFMIDRGLIIEHIKRNQNSGTPRRLLASECVCRRPGLTCWKLHRMWEYSSASITVHW